jgi:hypothetical protein
MVPKEPEGTDANVEMEDQHQQHFRLGDLPLELRDHIYDHSMVHETPVSLNGYKISTKESESAEEIHHAEREDVDTDMAMDPVDSDMQDLPPPPTPTPAASMKFHADCNVLLANRALKREYEQRALPARVLVLKDHENYSFQNFTLPDHAKSVRGLELHLIFFCHLCTLASHLIPGTCYAALEALKHREWITNLLPQLGNLRELEIFAHICHQSYELGDKKQLPCVPYVQTEIKKLEATPALKHLVLYRHDFVADNNLNGPKEVLYGWKDGEEVPVKKAEVCEISFYLLWAGI